MKQVVVIGGGAAGMMAALSAARSGASVELLEQNEKLGKKLYITGKGRCNYTNDAPMDAFPGQVCSNPRFLYSAFAAFSNQDMTDLLEQAGVRTKLERGGRRFPASDHASDVTKALETLLRGAGVSIHLNTRVLKLCLADGQVQAVRTAKGERRADAVIVACGGVSYPSTGATGDGYRFAEHAGLAVVPPLPALTGLVCEEPDLQQMQGLSLRNVRLAARVPGKKKPIVREGELLFTHYGISGPLGLSLSSDLARMLADGAAIPCEIDLKPALTDEQLDARILREVEEKQAKQVSHLFDDLLPRTMIPVALDRLGIAMDRRISGLTKTERQQVFDLLRHFTFTVTGTRGFNEAIITQGGVSVKEIRPQTMESKTVSGLYFAGEVLDVDAYTGGYNLQIAWSTGYLAGRSAASDG